MSENTIINSTVSNDLCINCGICKAVCPKGAVKLRLNKYNEKVPVIDSSKCIDCGLCAKYCPNTKEKMRKEAKKLHSIENPHTYGLENAGYYLAWDGDNEQRLKCCSGGAVTKLACYLSENKIIDGMVHVERVWAKRGELHYAARLSDTIDEIKEHVSSAYQSIDFSDVLDRLEKGKTYLITGTPCVIRGFRQLFKKHEKYRAVETLTCALVCSHNTNAQFIDFLTEINELETAGRENWKVNIRHKDYSMQDANNFKNYIYTKDRVLFDENRHKSGWSKIWRGYYFAMGSCLYCSDFWGYEADISVKDAWGEWAADPLGKSIVIVRNKELDAYFKKSGLSIEELDYKTMEKHQYATANFKQNEAFNKNFKSLFCRKNRKNGLLRYKLTSKITKFLYKKFGYKMTAFCMFFIDWFLIRLEKL